MLNTFYNFLSGFWNYFWITKGEGINPQTAICSRNHPDKNIVTYAGFHWGSHNHTIKNKGKQNPGFWLSNFIGI